MIKVITSKDNPRVKYALSLKESKARKENHQFLAESFKTLEMALATNLVREVFALEWLELPEDVTLNLVSEDILKKLSSSKNPEGVVFIADMKEKEDKKYNKILYLDEINDPGNLGTLIRTALAFSYDAVITSKNSVSFYNEKVIAASKGAIFKIDCFSDYRLCNGPVRELCEHVQDFALVFGAFLKNADLILAFAVEVGKKLRVEVSLVDFVYYCGEFFQRAAKRL